jgi:2,3-dihydroxybenzoate-AMP ligase
MPRPGFVPWPPDVARVYAEAGYWRGRPLGDLPWEWADRHGDRLAVVDATVRLTYRQLAERVDARASLLLDLGLRPGQPVVSQLANSAELVVTFLACLRCGLPPAMMLPAHREREMTGVAEHTGAAALLVPGHVRGFDHQALARRVAAAVPSVRHVLVDAPAAEVRPGSVPLAGAPAAAADADRRRARLDEISPDPADVALFLLSGGSTGTPKMIARTHNDYEYNARRSAEVCRFGPDTVYLACLPSGHNFPLGSPGLLGTLMAGGTAVMLPSPSAHTVLDAIARERVTVVAAVPAVATRWAQAAATARTDLSSLRTVQVGGSLLTPDGARRIAAGLRCEVQQVYGMAEGLLNFTHPDDGAARYVSQGRPMCPHDEVRLVDDEGRDVPDGQPGELLTRGPYTPRGYFAAPEHNAAAFTADGFFRTGDLVRRLPSGHLVVVGRIKDLINRGGEKIGADEVEHLVQLLPEVVEAAAVGWPDPELGERVCVFARLAAGEPEPGLERVRALFAQHQVATFKVPERLEFLDEFPRTAVGKTDKPTLRAWAAAGIPSGHVAAR